MKELSKRRRLLVCGIYFVLYLFAYQFVLSTYILRIVSVKTYLNIDLVVSMIILVSIIWISFPYLKHHFKAFNLMKKKYSSLLFTVLGLYATAILCTLLIVIPFHLGTSENQMNNELLFQYQPFHFLISALVQAPIVEEIVFRGCIFQPISKKNIFLGALTSGFVFGLLHVIASLEAGSWINFIYIIQYGLSGIVLSLAYGFTNNIFTSIFAHAIFNLISLLALI